MGAGRCRSQPYERDGERFSLLSPGRAMNEEERRDSGCSGQNKASAGPAGKRSPSVLLPSSWSSRLSVVWRIGLLLFILVLSPLAVLLGLFDAGVVHDLYGALMLMLALGLALIVPASRLAARFLVLDDLRSINDFCSLIQRGQYRTRFDLGLERDDEPELIRLKRNMNWMGHQIEVQNRTMLSRLDEVGTRQKFFEEMSYRDPLTKLFNRRYFGEFLELLDVQKGGARGVFLALIDCDCFKQVNDTHGHQVGDEVLVALGRIIAESVREREDFAFRFGGDEFGVVFCNLDLPSCLTVCERIRQRFKGGNAYGCTVSIGLAPWRESMGREQAAFLDACDQALYKAKKLGRDQVVSEVDETG